MFGGGPDYASDKIRTFSKYLIGTQYSRKARSMLHKMMVNLSNEIF